MSDQPPKPPRGRPRPTPKGFDDVPVLSDEEVERRVGVRGGGAPRAPLERAPRVTRPPRREERTTARDSLLLVGLVIVGLVAVRVFLPDGPLTASATSGPTGNEAAVATATAKAVPTAGVQTLVPVITLEPGTAAPTDAVASTSEPTDALPTPTLKPGQTPKPTPKPTPAPTPASTAPRATVIVVMDVINNSGGTTPASAWTMVISGEASGGASNNYFPGSESGTSVTIPAGKGYRVLDDASQAGYAPRLASGDCTRADGVGLPAGTTVTCTITRNDRPRVRVVTHVINDNGGSSLASAWAVSVTSSNATPSSFQGSEAGTVVVLGFDISFAITASGPSGYAESVSGDCSSSVGLGIDDPATLCTLTYDDDAPPPSSTILVPPMILPLLRPRRWRTTATG